MKRILKTIPSDLEQKLFEEYAEIKRLFQLNDCGPSELNGGRFAEAILRIFQYLLAITITPFGTDIEAREKTRIINKVTSDPRIEEHIRQKVTVLARLLLDFRNNRDVAHLGGFSANKIDANFVLTCANWIVAEFIRVFGNYTMDSAQKIIDKIAIPNYPVIFEIDGEEFISRNDLTARQEILVLLSKVNRDFNFLFSKTKDANKSRFAQTLASMENKKLIAVKGGFYYLLPNGIKAVQEKDLLTFK